MSYELQNGGILPSSLLGQDNESYMKAFNKTYNSVQLRAGIIVKTYDITNSKNIKKGAPEYDVQVLEQDGANGTTLITYKNCSSIDSMGGVADFFEYKRREKTQEKQSDDLVNNDGQLVLLLCLDGASEKGIIIGGLKHASRLSQLTAEAGLHLQGEYNGVNWKVDKDGAFTLTFKGPTKNDGTLQKESIAGSQAKIDKDGSIELNTNYTKDNKVGEKVRLDKAKGEISVSARNNTTISTGKDFSVTAKGSANISAEKDFIAKITGSATMSCKTFNLTSDQAISIKGADTSLELTGGLIIKSTTMELNAETVKVGTGASALAVLGPQLLTWLSTHSHGNGNFGTPTTAPLTPPPQSMLSSTVSLKA